MGSKTDLISPSLWLFQNTKHETEQEANDGEGLSKGETVAMVSGPQKQQSANKLKPRCFITVRLMCVACCVRCSINNPITVVGSIHCLR